MSAASRIIVAATGAAATIIVARLLGPAGAGAYAIAQTLIALLTVATTLGVEHGIVYYVSSGRWAAAAAFRSAQRVALLSGLAGAAAGILARMIVPSAFRSLSVPDTIVAAAALPFALSWLYVSYTALAVDRYEAYVLPAAIQSVAAMALVATLAAVDGVGGAVLGFTAAHVITAAVMLIAGRPRRGSDGHPASGADEPGQLRRAISFGVRGYAANALQFVNYRLDLFILNAAVTTAAVGQYSVAVAVTTVLWLLPQALGDVLFPRVAALAARTTDDAEAALAMAETKGLRHCLVLTVVATTVLALALLLLVVPIYGPRFEPAIDLGLILLPGSALLGLASPLSAIVVGRGHPRMMLTVTLIVTPVTIVLYLVLIPTLHADGAALASTISYSATFLLVAGFHARVTGNHLLTSMLPTRSEWDDYRRLGPAIATWATGLHRR